MSGLLDGGSGKMKMTFDSIDSLFQSDSLVVKKTDGSVKSFLKLADLLVHRFELFELFANWF